MRLKLTIAVIGVFVLGYLLQLPTPLRLNTDAVVYVALGASLADGHGLQFYHERTHFPPGLPVVYAGLSRGGLLCSASIVAINILFLLLGCVAVFYLLTSSLKLTTPIALTAGLLTLASYLFIKHVTLPISDVVYFGLSCAALALLASATAAVNRDRAYRRLLAAVLVTSLAISVRYIGVALLPAIGWTMLSIHRESLRRVQPATWLILALTTAAGVGVLAALALRSRYLSEMLAMYHTRGMLATVWLIVQFRARELGELLINIPGSRLPPRLNLFVPAVGAALALALAWALCKRRRQWTTLEVYLLAYLVMMTVWPYGDARFQAPILPLLFGTVATALIPAPRWGRIIATIFTVLFCTAGLAALAYSTGLTYSGRQFADRYGDDPPLRAAYHLAFQGSPPPPGVPINIPVLDMLRRYEKLSIQAD